MTNLKTITHPLIDEVATRMRAQLDGNPAALIASLEQQLQIGENLTRPTLTLLFGNLFGLEQNTMIDIAASIEMLHQAKLVHDNLGNQSFSQIPKTPFITSATVLAGDLAFAAAARLATAPQSTTVMRIFSETLQMMVSGEITYMFQNGSGFEPDSYYRRIHAQTASLFELACQATAILAAMDEETINAARQFGYEMGMAFQIVDDVLDFTGDPEVMGKPTGNDLRQGTLTLPTLYYLEANPNDPDLDSIIRRNGHSQDSIKRVIKAIRQSEAITLAQQEAQRFLEQGLRALYQLPDRPARAKLEQLAIQMINRNR